MKNLAANSITRELFYFTIAGTSGFIADAGIVWLITSRGLGPIKAQAIAFSMAVLITWGINRTFTFRSSLKKKISTELMQYIAANSIGAVVNNAIYALLVMRFSLFAAVPVLAVAAGSIAGLGFNFTSSKMIIFRTTNN